ncbi:MAG TPA: biotin/lipoyl-binding protein, partial [Myxococcota bacterium]|nr:biotin/lipoyl-binding protein [Myxococcota bacterium]
MLPRRPRATRALALPAVLAAACALACGAGDDHGHGGPPEPVVELVTVEPQLLRNLVDIPGQLASEFTAKVRPEIEGILQGIHFAEGDEVVKGVPLFTLKDEQQRAELAQAEASLKLAQATYNRTSTLKRQDVSSEAQLERAQAELAVAQARVEVSRVGLARMTVRAPFDGLLGQVEEQLEARDRVGLREHRLAGDAVAGRDPERAHQAVERRAHRHAREPDARHLDARLR